MRKRIPGVLEPVDNHQPMGLNLIVICNLRKKQAQSPFFSATAADKFGLYNIYALSLFLNATVGI
jgi:hypothetical protein